MILDRIDLRGFGCLRDRAFAFSPGLNLIVGPNEAGKSTLLQAIQALLYGFFKDSNVWAGGATRERLRPWTNDPYGGTLCLHLANGEQYQIERTFSNERTTVYRNPGATDVTSSYGPGSHGWVDFADRQLGLTPAVFRASAYIQQGDLYLTRPAVTALHAKLETLVDSGGAEQSAQSALAYLEAWLKERVNPNAYISERSPLKTAEAAVARLGVELKKSQVSLEDLATLVAEENALAGAVATSTDHVGALEAYIAWTEAEALDRKLGHLGELDQLIAAAERQFALSTDVAGVTEIMLDAATHAVTEAYRLAEVARLGKAQVSTESAALQDSQDALDRVDAELAVLSHVANVSLVDLSAARDAVTAWNDGATRQREADDARETVRTRREQWQTSLDPRLARRTDVDVDRLRAAVGNAAMRRGDLNRASESAATGLGSTQIETEYAALQARLGNLTADELETMRGLETDYRLAAARYSNRQSVPALPVAVVAALLGLVVGFVIAGVAGAVAGTIAVGALAFVGLSRRRVDDEGAAIEKTRAALSERLRAFDVQSVGELQKLWNDRSDARDRLGERRNLGARVERAQAEADDAGAEIDRLIQVKDLDEARQILALLESWAKRKADVEREEQQAKAQSHAAERTGTERRSTAETMLAGLGRSAESPAEARQVVADLTDEWGTRAKLLPARTTLAAKLAGFSANLTSLDENWRELTSAETEAAGRLKALGIDADPTSWEGDLARCRQRFDDRQAWLSARDVSSEARKALVGTDDPAAWETRLVELRSRALPLPDGDSRTLDELHAAKRCLDSALVANRDRLTRLATQREEKSSRFADPSELEEQLAEAETQLIRIKRLGDGLRETQKLMRQVADDQRRDYAPRLEQSLSEWLGRATDGRYSEVRVSPEDLSVKLKSVQAGALVAIDRVSQGTQDAVALLLRAAMVDLLSGSTESVPLFLDDPLVNVDASRSQHILALLLDLAAQRQIFYFTHDRQIEAWLGAGWTGQVHRLGEPS